MHRKICETMKKNIHRRQLHVRKVPYRSRRRMVWLIMMVIVFCGVGVFTYTHMKTRFVRFNQWVVEKKSHFQKKLDKKLVAVEEPQVHFEFYTALPNMQVTVSQAISRQEKPIAPSKQIAAKTVFLNPDELEHDFLQSK